MENNVINTKRAANEWRREYVPVVVSFDSTGRMRPLRITWRDGTHYNVTTVKGVMPAPALRAGGQGDRYTVEIRGQVTYLFFEHAENCDNPAVGRWFVEQRASQVAGRI